MRSEIVSREGNPVVIRIEIEAEAFRKAVDDAVRTLSRDADIKGFRKGHVPRRVLEMYVGSQGIYKEALDNVVSDAVREVVDEYELQLLADPGIDLKSEVAEGHPVILEASFLVRPEITLADVADIKVEKQSFPVSDEDVENEIKGFCDRHGNIVVADERGLAPTDIAIVHYASYAEGEDTPFEEERSRELPLSTGMLRHEIRDVLVGKRRGEDAEVTVKMADNVEGSLAGKNVCYKFHIEDIKEHCPMEFTDENIRAFSEGRIGSTEEMRREVRRQLELSAVEHAEGLYLQGIVEQFVEKSTVGDIPEQVFEARMQALREDDKRAVESRLGLERHLSDDEMLAQIGKDAESYKGDLRQRSESIVRRDLVLDVFAETHQLAPNDAELEAELRRTAYRMQMPLKKVYELAGKNRRFIDQLWQTARTRKIYTTLLQMVSPKGDESTPETTEAEA